MTGYGVETNPNDRIDLIVLRAQSGDRSAFMELVNRFSGMSYATAYAIVRNKEDAEDAVQDAFIQAHRHLHTLTDPTRFAPWLRSIVRQQCCGLIRICRRRLRHWERVSSESFRTVPAPFVDRPREQVFQQELWDRCMAVLNRRAREITLLYYMEGYSCIQIAEILQLSDGAVKSHLHKARKTIERQLQRMGVQSLECLE